MKNQYEKFTDDEGNPCRVSADTAMAAMYRLMPSSLEESIMFRPEGFATREDLFDKLGSTSKVR